MASETLQLRSVVILIDLQQGVTVQAGNNIQEAMNAHFQTSGPITTQDFVDEIFQKLLRAIHGGDQSVPLRIRDGKFIAMASPVS